MIKLIKPYIEFDDVAGDLRKIFESGQLTLGPYVKNFITALESYTGAPHAFTTTSATTALWAVLKVLGIGEGDEVIVADFSFPATVNVVEDVGARPVFADVDPDTYNLRPDELERKITPRTKAVMFVDALGNPSGITAIAEICRERGIMLIDDAACALGSSEAGIKSGNLADFTCLSFHPRKLLTTGEGGAILTRRPEYAEKLRIKLAHGARPADGKFEFIDYGYNFRMSEVQAAMGLAQLPRLDDITAARRKMREEYIQLLEPMGFKAQRINPDVVYNVQSLVFAVPPGVNRETLTAKLREAGVESTIGTYCLSGCDYYRRKYHDLQPIAEHLFRHTITLPCHPAVDVAAVGSAISGVL